MEPITVIAILGTIIFVLLLVGAPMRPIRWIGFGITRFCIGALLLFLLNAIGNSYDIHIPINAFTALISGIAGLPGIASLVAIEFFILN
ncbi:MAG: pro-sigmaK processing inhibitor BofA family protein [Bacillota bacterium]|jgi:inhibitor of the pro-sigma K processing machinery|uniref:Transcriptional regulator n=4 Tax=Fictibacillus TaxID=1329200 RepID=A0A160IJJ4_9BACL|nr:MULTISPECIES: pro-sigmaK processing inhibitor BofA family protein [Bacillaceae]MBN3552704.1 pro-sigmaK processing inhibitor BofA family protein [Fictibacillus nanhaiensis]ANC75362.1 transcriptional regulator [Fictibacillus phosphorivorans]MBD7966420.1 pro-sigmaK processing inhibitor BofA family protein [Fictibacillus norfolkensis]MBH0159123.1 pro-sigmaK processing inhibitor BofA family protein [Fictibacillus sp. 5RED26]MBH0163270.1 pro-sigmaK processing inhibitor BofA family protein [Fictib